ncbi:MAG: sulfatase [Verrucomicrobia bacterium]|nr:sulfatase [Verrucomicrobiota bacterium]
MTRLLTSFIALLAVGLSAAARQPNVVIIFADDLGYGDLGCYGHPTIRTPHLDRMASEGIRFTQFYSAAEVCTPSRAALMTGRYPVRSGMAHNQFRVLRAVSTGGLPQGELTMAESLKSVGYRTGIIGKWHLGVWANDRPEHHPLNHGFDFHFGLMHSNDMNPSPKPKPKKANAQVEQDPEWWDAALYRGRELLVPRTDQTQLTRRYAEEAAKFIGESKDRPFFLYMPHTFPHTPLFASDRFKGRSPRGIYGDVLAELDWSVGEVLKALNDTGVADNTLVFFTSDNGPWTWMGAETGGSAGLLRDGKGSTWEGGMRVPGIAWWPGRIRPAVSDAVLTTMDLLPTVAKLAGAELPKDRPYDGKDASPVLFEGRGIERDVFCYYRGETLFAARLGDWKAHFITQGSYGDPKPVKHDRPLLYNLAVDPSEAHEISADHPDVVARLQAAVERHRATITPVRSQLIDVVAK